MVDPVGTTLGAASLALQLLDGCVKGPYGGYQTLKFLQALS